MRKIKDTIFAEICCCYHPLFLVIDQYTVIAKNIDIILQVIVAGRQRKSKGLSHEIETGQTWCGTYRIADNYESPRRKKKKVLS
jgi:hypothetical protein